MWPRFVWDLNISTILAIVVGGITFYVGVLRQRDMLRDVQKAVEHWKLELLGVKANHDVLKELVLKEYVRRGDLDPVIDRLMDRIDKSASDQLAAIHRINDQLIELAKQAPGPPTSRR